MIVLHSHWLPPPKPSRVGGFLFWAEVSPDERRGGAAAHRETPRHPFTHSARVLRDHPQLARYLAAGSESSVVLSLPSADDRPLLSPALNGGDSAAAPSLAQWRVPGVRLPAAAAADALISLPTSPGALAGVHLGDDCVYWRLVAGLAFEAVAAQKLLPGLECDADGKHRARWRPVLDAPQDDARVAKLVAAMPPVCRAQPGAQGEHPSAGALLDAVLSATTDALVRSWAPDAAKSSRHRYWNYSGYYGVDASLVEWVFALFDQDHKLAAAPAIWEQLRLKHETWTRPLRVTAGSEYRPAFRLQAPAANTDGAGAAPDQPYEWRLHYAVQAREDPSLLLPAEAVWGQASGLGRSPQRTREVLLAALGCAARLFPPVANSLAGSHPDSCALDTGQAYAFLREVAPVLEQSGCAVLVPPWWASARARLRRRLRLRAAAPAPPSDSTGSLSFDKLVSFQWQIALGDANLTEEEFRSLAALKSPLVQIRGEWVHLDPEQVEAAIAFWQQGDQQGEISLLDAVRLGMESERELGGIPVDDVSVEGWLEDWLGRLTGKASLELLPQPGGLHGQLRPYQVQGYSWLVFLRRYGVGGILADDMGLGKTVQAIALLLREKEQLGGRLPAPTLLVAPTSVVANWEREVRRFAPDLTVLVHQGAGRVRGDDVAEAIRGADLVLTSYALARRDVAALRDVRWHGVILDEAQNIKNPASAQSRAVQSLAAGFRFALTGTPVENRVTELWSIMRFLNPGHLGSLEAFRRHYGTPIERYGDERAREALRQLVGPLILRRVKTDPRVAPDLPEKVETKTFCHLSEEQATLYEAAVRNAMSQVEQSDGIQRRGLVLSMLMQLKQICNHPVQYLHQTESDGDWGHLRERSGKLQRLGELLEEIAAVGERTLVFTQFAEMAGLLHRHLDRDLGYAALLFTGATPVPKRQQLIERFQADGGEPMVFVISLKAGGTGLNLTAASHVIHYDRWWNPAVEDQATDRAHRIGQRRNVQVHKFISLGTLEEAIDEMIEGKRALARSIIGGGEDWVTELSTDDLRRLVELRP